MDWSELGLGGGIVVVVLGFLAHLKGEREDRKATRDSFLLTIQNHMDHNTEAINGLCTWLKAKME